MDAKQVSKSYGTSTIFLTNIYINYLNRTQKKASPYLLFKLSSFTFTEPLLATTTEGLVPLALTTLRGAVLEGDRKQNTTKGKRQHAYHEV